MIEIENIKENDEVQSTLFFLNPWKRILFENYYNNENTLLYKITDNEVKSYSGKKIYFYLQFFIKELEKIKIKKYDSIYLESQKTLLSYLTVLLSLSENYVLFFGFPNDFIDNILNQIQPNWFFLYTKLNDDNNQLQFIKEIEIDGEVIYIYKSKNNFVSSVFQIFYLSMGMTKEKEWIGFTKEQVLKILSIYNSLISNYSIVFSMLPWNLPEGIWLELLLSIIKPLRLYFIYKENFIKDFSKIDKFLSKKQIDFIVFYPSYLKNFTQQTFDYLKHIPLAIITGTSIPNDKVEILKRTNLQNAYFIAEIGLIFLSEKGKIQRNYLGKLFSDLVEIDFYPDGELAIKSELISKCKIKFNQCMYCQNDCWLNTGDIVIEKNKHYYYLGRKRNFISIDKNKWFNPFELEEILRRNFLTENIVIISDKNHQIKVLLENELFFLQNEVYLKIQRYLKENRINNSIELIFLDKSFFVRNIKGEIDKRFFKYIQK
jgi:hypothetical protein